MSSSNLNVLFLCTGNSARSIIAEGILRKLGGETFFSYSAGSHPAGKPNPFALAVLRDHDIDVSFARSKRWEEFANSDAPKMDLIITVVIMLPVKRVRFGLAAHQWRTGVFLIQLLCKAAKKISWTLFGQHTWKWKPAYISWWMQNQPQNQLAIWRVR